MKIIIVYASTGAGHRKAAEAVYHSLKQKPQFPDIKLIDVLDKTNPIFKNIYVYGYLFLINYVKWLWSIFFKITSARPLRGINNAYAYSIAWLNSAEFREFLIQEQPDTVISTHFLPSQIVSCLKRKNRLKSKLITVITDFAVHPFWITDGTDIYVAASSFTKDILLSKGIAQECIKEFGIPVDLKFTKQYEKTQLYEKLGLKPDEFTVLITTGSFGVGPVEKIVDLLHKHTRIMVVCANNKWLYKTLKYRNYPDVKLFGFVDNMHELMAVSDIVIAKPGGLTISEILCMERVPIFIWPIPGQETGNLKAMESYGIKNYARRIEDIRALVLDYKLHPDKLDKIREIIKQIKEPSAVEDLYNVIR